MTDDTYDAADAALTAAAFGSAPGTWPLPSATTPRRLWLRAVAAGGQGRFASAGADLAVLLRLAPAGRWASLAHSAQGSFLRQLGGHALARRWDGRALALAGEDPEAVADALVGLAADALGVGRFTVSTALLARVDALPEALGTPAGRLAVRRGWVGAELAMATGDGPAAVRHARSALELTTELTARHRVKSQVVLAAALCCAGSPERARAVADTALEAAGRLGLVPLRWALACLLVDVGSATHTSEQVRAIRDHCDEVVRRRGGSWQ